MVVERVGYSLGWEVPGLGRVERCRWEDGQSSQSLSTVDEVTGLAAPCLAVVVYSLPQAVRKWLSGGWGQQNVSRLAVRYESGRFIQQCAAIMVLAVQNHSGQCHLSFVSSGK